jgi:hypothetical protein
MDNISITYLAVSCTPEFVMFLFHLSSRFVRKIAGGLNPQGFGGVAKLALRIRWAKHR